MRFLTLAVLFGIVLMGCNSADFRGSHWGDSRDEVKSNEFDYAKRKRSSGSSGIPYSESLKGGYVYYRFSLPAKQTMTIWKTDMTLHGAIRYYFDDELLTHASIFIGNPEYHGADRQQVVNHFINLHGKPTKTWVCRGAKEFDYATTLHLEWQKSRTLISLKTNSQKKDILVEYKSKQAQNDESEPNPFDKIFTTDPCQCD